MYKNSYDQAAIKQKYFLFKIQDSHKLIKVKQYMESLGRIGINEFIFNRPALNKIRNKWLYSRGIGIQGGLLNSEEMVID